MTSSVWTFGMIETLRYLADQGHTRTVIAEIMGRSPGSISSAIKAHKISGVTPDYKAPAPLQTAEVARWNDWTEPANLARDMGDALYTDVRPETLAREDASRAFQRQARRTSRYSSVGCAAAMCAGL